MCHGSSGSAGNSLSTESTCTDLSVPATEWTLIPFDFSSLRSALADWLGISEAQLDRLERSLSDSEGEW
jgi:hypothetical protein